MMMSAKDQHVTGRRFATARQTKYRAGLGETCEA